MAADRPPPPRRGTFREVPGAERVIEAAVDGFVAEFGDRPARDLTVVIPALDEVGSVAAVVAAVPAEVVGLSTEILVVDDGSTDGTGDAARAAGAMVCRLDTNLGQGRAFRVGYRLARSRGSAVIATIDADGQFDPAELGRLVDPIVAGRADFVNGSRRLGRAETVDGLRSAGVVLFGALMSILTRTRITDPSNGFRAFRAEVVAHVPLQQVQYQTAELLLGADAVGFRIAEVPVTVRARTAGVSKKGSNWRYALRFARVVIGTWWRLRPLRRARGPQSRRPPG